MESQHSAYLEELQLGHASALRETQEASERKAAGIRAEAEARISELVSELASASELAERRHEKDMWELAAAKMAAAAELAEARLAAASDLQAVQVSVGFSNRLVVLDGPHLCGRYCVGDIVWRVLSAAGRGW